MRLDRPVRWGAPLLLALAALWLAWPLLRPRLWPASGAPWLVVLDGYHRLDWALQLQARNPAPILLITCPATGQPTAAQWARRRQASPLLVLHEGVDTAGQAAALARWLQQRQRQGQPLPRQLLLVSDPHHFPRASWAAQIAVGSSGSRVIPMPVPASSPLQLAAQRKPRWPQWRDALRLQLWRASGSTGAVLRPATLERKIQACYGAFNRAAAGLGAGQTTTG